MKEQQAEIKTDVNWLKKGQKEHSSKLDSIASSLNCFINTADDKYADKEKVEEMDKQVQNINVRLAKWSSVIAVVFIIIDVGLRYFMN